MSKTKAQLLEEIAQLRARNMSAAEAQEYREEALRLEKILEEHGIPHPDCLTSQIERIEEQYRKEIMQLAKECEHQTGRELGVCLTRLPGTIAQAMWDKPTFSGGLGIIFNDEEPI